MIINVYHFFIKKVKGTSRGPEALQSHLNDSYHTNMLSVLKLKGTKVFRYQR